MLPKTYAPQEVEQKHYQAWEENGLFEPDPTSDKEPYTIMIPPPNVTGVLHCGHALCMTLQDVLVRHARMQGKDVLWQPGTDHAGIATQRIVAQNLAKEGISRTDLGREKFLEKVWEWKEHSGGEIVGQLKRLGASCAWKRERFTMDEGLSKSVRKVFVELYNKGLIYRGTRLVNWDPNYQTAVSDIEVNHKELNGHIWHMCYPLADGSGTITVATTRPETMLGDTAVAVNPEDARYKHLIGQKIKLPLVDREIEIIADDYVDMDFGSGFVKITPAHDFNDYEVGQRHNLEMINVLTLDAKINENAPKQFQGMDRFVARKAIVAAFEELDLMEKIEDHTHNVAHAERDNTVLEPYLTTQWYVKTDTLAARALDVVKTGEVEFIPKNWEKTYFHWLENIQDWCISRQLWWGHQIPAWYKGSEVYVGEQPPEGEGWVQDEDVLDTWFSSALWPFSTLGWPEKTPELNKYYSTDVLVTGYDIIFFWVARMVMMGLEFTDKVPFKKVFMHALVRDEHGKKMSKSFGNVLDPIVLMDKYGTDALRFTVTSLTAPGADIRLSDAKVEEGRNFCTKLWNASRFAIMNGVTYDASFDPQTIKHPVNKWIIGELSALVEKLEKSYDDFRFNDNAQSLYHFTWGTYCDWYLELTKSLVQSDDADLATETKQTLGFVLERLLRLLHPITPFITEEIWQTLTDNQTSDSYLMTQAWPKAADLPHDKTAVEEVTWLIHVITGIRQARSEHNVPPKAHIKAEIQGASAQDTQRLETFASFIEGMTKTSDFSEKEAALADTDVVAVVEGFEIVLPLEGLVDHAAEKERVTKEIAKFEAELSKIEGMLGNDNFVARAPEAVVNEQKERKEVILADLGKLKGALEARS